MNEIRDFLIVRPLLWLVAFIRRHPWQFTLLCVAVAVFQYLAAKKGWNDLFGGLPRWLQWAIASILLPLFPPLGWAVVLHLATK